MITEEDTEETITEGDTEQTREDTKKKSVAIVEDHTLIKESVQRKESDAIGKVDHFSRV